MTQNFMAALHYIWAESGRHGKQHTPVIQCSWGAVQKNKRHTKKYGEVRLRKALVFSHYAPFI